MLSKDLHEFGQGLIHFLKLGNLDFFVLVVTGIVDSFDMHEAEIIPILVFFYFVSGPYHLASQIGVIVACHALYIVEEIKACETTNTSNDRCRTHHEGFESVLLDERW